MRFFENSKVTFYKSITEVFSVRVSGPQQKWSKFYLGSNTSNTLPTNSIMPSTMQDTKKAKIHSTIPKNINPNWERR